VSTRAVAAGVAALALIAATSVATGAGASAKPTRYTWSLNGSIHHDWTGR
jgi:hypothetical protein